jgi:hypothetical protein
MWLIAVPIAVAAAVVVLALGELRLGGLFLGTTVLTIVGYTWILWSIPSLPLDTSQLTPIPRAVGALVLLSVAFAPLFVWRLYEAQTFPRYRLAPMRRRSAATSVGDTRTVEAPGS